MSLVICEKASASVPRTACMAWVADAGVGSSCIQTFEGGACNANAPHDFDNQCSAAIVVFSSTMPICAECAPKCTNWHQKVQITPRTFRREEALVICEKSFGLVPQTPYRAQGRSLLYRGCCLSYFEGMECNVKYKMIPMISITISFQQQ